MIKNKKTTLFLGLLITSFSLLSSSIAYTQAAKDGGAKGKKHILDYGQLQDESKDFPKKSFEDTLYKVNLDTFEDGGNWFVSMPSDYGIASIAHQKGAPALLKKDGDGSVNAIDTGSNNKKDPNAKPAAKPAAKDGKDDQNTNRQFFYALPDPKSQVLGLKVNFFGGRKSSWLRIDSIDPISLKGHVQGFEFWAVGRSIANKIYVIVEDINGKERLIDAGDLNFDGWRRVSVQVPQYIQQELLGDIDRGLVFKGFLIKFNLASSYGRYYFYLDNLSAEISRFQEENALPDNPKDTW